MFVISIIIFSIFVALVIYRCYKYCFYRPKNFPPGPPRLPKFGSYLFLQLINHKNKHLAINWLCNYYKSSVIGFYIGNMPTVYANDSKTVREVLFRQEFDGRPDVLLARIREPNFNLKGIFFIEGDYWLHQRRFTLRNLRDFGFGRRFPEYENEVLDEMKKLVETIKEGPKYEHEKKYFAAGGKVHLPRALIGAMGNSFLQVLANERLSREDQYKIFNAGEGSFTFQKEADEYGKIFGLIPWIRFFFPDKSGFRPCREGSLKMTNFMKDIIDRQIETYEDGHIRSFLDMYIEKMKRDEESVKKDGFMYDQMLMMCTDFLFPSLSAIEAQVAFLLRILVDNKRILKKIEDEIEKVVGSGRLVNLDDRVNLPYTEACLRETLRFETLVPSSVVHSAMVDTELNGYFIPKDSYVYPGLHALHFDKELWGDPENFRPERFIEQGSLSLKNDKSLPFGGGRRLCAGETFARNTMFLCITALVQNFNLKVDQNAKLPDLKQTRCGLTRIPENFWLKFEAK